MYIDQYFVYKFIDTALHTHSGPTGLAWCDALPCAIAYCHCLVQ